ISSYHSSLLRPRRKPTMVMVMLSQPTPPVSEFDARQLSIMFSQILSRSCLAAMPRRTNSTTAWEDWQSQIPSGKKKVYVSLVFLRDSQPAFVGIIPTHHHKQSP